MTSVMNGRGVADTGVYSGVARFLHWTIATCVLTMIPIGILMNRIPGVWCKTSFIRCIARWACSCSS